MEFRNFAIEGPVEIIPRKLSDERGYFSEVYRADLFFDHIGKFDFVQENQSLSLRTGTIRGIHFQSSPVTQAKLVRCLAGKVFDVAVDLRHGSAHYGRWIATVLTPDDNNQLWVPAGFGHAFCTLEPNSVIGYRVTNYYSQQNDKGVAWDDPDIGVEWPSLANPETLSQKDRRQPTLANLPQYFSKEA